MNKNSGTFLRAKEGLESADRQGSLLYLSNPA